MTGSPDDELRREPHISRRRIPLSRLPPIPKTGFPSLDVPWQDFLPYRPLLRCIAWLFPGTAGVPDRQSGTEMAVPEKQGAVFAQEVAGTIKKRGERRSKWPRMSAGIPGDHLPPPIPGSGKDHSSGGECSTPKETRSKKQGSLHWTCPGRTFCLTGRWSIA